MNFSKLEFFPLSFFSIIMGLTGYTISLQKLEKLLSYPYLISTTVLYIISFLFFIILITYIIKFLKFKPSVYKELSHPIKISFAPTFTISIILLSIAYYDLNTNLSRILWIIGSSLHLLSTIAILSYWIRQSKFEITHFNPAWFIPIVGNILIPIIGVNHANSEISWFFYSIGIVFWLLFFTIFIYRIFFHHPLPEKLLPTFFILIAPPALGFISYLNLTNNIDNFAKILYYFALFLTIFLFSQFTMFKKIKYYLSWWAYSFPLAAITIASSLMYSITNIIIYKLIFFTLLTFLSIFIIILILNTIKAIIANKICLPED